MSLGQKNPIERFTIFPFRCDYDGKHLKPRDSLVSHILNEGEVDHIVSLLKEREIKKNKKKQRQKPMWATSKKKG